MGTEISFEDRFTENSKRIMQLSPMLREEFYNRLRGLVVFIQTKYNKVPPSKASIRTQERFPKAEENLKEKNGAGVFMTEGGAILTCSRLVSGNNVVSVKFSFEHNRNEFLDATVVCKDQNLDLAILLPTRKLSRDYAMLSPDERVDVGMEVFTVSHPAGGLMKYTFSCGEVTYPNYRLKKEILPEEGRSDDSDAGRVTLMSSDCEVIPMNNIHGSRSSLGSPVFDSCGRVVGLTSFLAHGLDFAVHITAIKRFWGIHQDYLNQKMGEIETNQPMETESSSRGGRSSKDKGKTPKGSGTKSVIPPGKAFGISEASYQKTLGMQNVDDSINTTISVGGLNDSVSAEQLRQIFSPYGQLVHVKVLVGEGCGFVQFADSHCAEVALKMLNGTQLGGQNIRLSWGRSLSNEQTQLDPNQWNSESYGYQRRYETGGCVRSTQDPNMYYGSYLDMEITSKPPNSSSRSSPSPEK